MKKKLILLTSMAGLCLGIANKTYAGTNCVFSNDGKSVTITGSGSGEYFMDCLYGNNTYENGAPYTLPSNWKSVIENVTFGDGVKTIGGSAFNGASKLTTVNTGNVTSIGAQAFNNTSKLTSIDMPKVTSIGQYAFWNATNLTNVSLPEVSILENGVFTGDSKLTNIELPKISRVDDYAFFGSGITSIDLSNATSLGGKLFVNSKVSEIIIPDSWADENVSIDDTLFYGSCLAALHGQSCQNTKIVCQGNVEKCKTALAKFGAKGICTLGETACMSPDINIVSTTNPSQCSGNYGWSGAGCARKDSDGKVACASGFVEWDKQCLSEYPFAKKRWTPAEANEWLHDGNDNFVVITFKK